INGENKRDYKANELHFPSVAKELQWKDLSIIDWIDINPFSQEYIFLKELGVKEAPDLHDLFLHITQEHNQTSKIKSEYQLPPSLIYFAENFRKHYFKIWENNKIIQIPFLSSSSPPHINQSTEVILTIPQLVFKETIPLSPSLLPDVIRYFSHYKKQYEILTIESASLYFSYLNKLDGLNKTFIENVSKKSFIPYSSSSYYSKPSQIFIRSETLSSPDDIVSFGLIDYIDYGPEANKFLFIIGVVSSPSPEILLELLIDRQSSYFSQTRENTDEIIKDKLRFYTKCLKQLASISNIKEKFQHEPLKSDLMNKPWCLAYRIIENNETIFEIVKPTDV
ncbi:unnamed protein product, partial [Adineta steineri]